MRRGGAPGPPPTWRAATSPRAAAAMPPAATPPTWVTSGASLSSSCGSSVGRHPVVPSLQGHLDPHERHVPLAAVGPHVLHLEQGQVRLTVRHAEVRPRRRAARQPSSCRARPARRTPGPRVARAPGRSPRAAWTPASGDREQGVGDGVVEHRGREVCGRDVVGGSPEVVALRRDPGPCRRGARGPLGRRETETVRQLRGPLRQRLRPGQPGPRSRTARPCARGTPPSGSRGPPGSPTLAPAANAS